MSSIQPVRWATHLRRLGIMYIAGSGVFSYFAVKAFLKARRSSRTNPLRLLGLSNFYNALSASLSSKHLRNMLLASGLVALALHRALGQRLPGFMGHSVFGSFLLFFATAWYLYYRLRVIEKPMPRYQRTMWNMAIMERFRVRPFRPIWWGFNCHAQTVLCNALNTLDDQLQPFSKYERELLPAFDGNSIVLDWAAEGKDFGPATPIAFVMHGILGSAEENYCRNLVKLCLKRGWRPVVNFRWRIDFGENRDIESALATIHKRYPSAPIVAVAYSAGAHVLLTYLQKVKKATPLVGAVVVSAAYDLVKMIKFASKTKKHSYHLALSSFVRQCVSRHVEWDKLLDKQAADHIVKTMHKMMAHEVYDKFLTCMQTFSGKMAVSSSVAAFGEAGRSPYLAGALAQEEYSPFGNPTQSHYRFTAANNMSKVAIPTLVLHAEDDPVCSPDFCPLLRSAASTNKNIIVLMTRRGGHSGWHQGTYPTGPSWAEKSAVDFLSGLLSAHAHTAFTLDVVRRSLRSGQMGLGPGTSYAAAARRATVPRDGEDSDGEGSAMPASWNATLDSPTPMSAPLLARICSSSDLQYPNATPHQHD